MTEVDHLGWEAGLRWLSLLFLVCSLLFIDSVRIYQRCPSKRRSCSTWRALTSLVRHSLHTRARWCRLCGACYPESQPSDNVRGFPLCNQLTTSFRSVADPESVTQSGFPWLLPRRNWKTVYYSKSLNSVGLDYPLVGSLGHVTSCRNVELSSYTLDLCSYPETIILHTRDKTDMLQNLLINKKNKYQILPG